MPDGAAPNAQAAVLVVDDLLSSRTLIDAVLRGAGYADISFACDGEEALARVAERVPDIIILDIVMPRLDGLEVCRQVREQGLDIPILVQTGLQEADERARAFDVGATDIVSKPVNARELVARVGLHLERRQLIGRLQRWHDRMQEELRVAEGMQTSLLPSQDRIAETVGPRGARLDSFYRASNRLGGDLWQVRPVDDHRFQLFVVDLSGHGVAAAINAFRLHMLTGRIADPATAPDVWLGELNRALCDILPVEHFATALAGVYDGRSGQFEYAAAGSPSPLVLRADGACETLDGSGLILGCSTAARYERRSATLAPGDRIFTYSDALVEDFSQPAASLGSDDVERHVRAALKAGGLDGACRRLYEQVFTEAGRVLQDDLTLLMLEAGADR